MSEYPSNSPVPAGRRVRSLRDLPQQMAPGRDLWPQIKARLDDAPMDAARLAEAQLAQTQPARTQPALTGWRMRLAAALGLLALGAALTIGMWMVHGSAVRRLSGSEVGVGGQSSLPMQVVDPQARAAALRSLSARLQSLPPPSRQKVLTDLKVIEQSMQDVQAALGRDPGNALLREMLLETYQDEQHLIATVREAAAWTEQAGSGRGST